MQINEIQLPINKYTDDQSKLYVLSKNVILIQATLDLYLEGLELRLTKARRAQWPSQLLLQVSIIFSQKSIVQKGICPHTQLHGGLNNRHCGLCGLCLEQDEMPERVSSAFIDQAFERINALAWLMNLELSP